MKKIVLVTLSLLVAGAIFLLSAARTATVSSKGVNPPATSSPGAITKEAAQKADYFLAYPGILPDHFLYPIKMIRDKVWLFFTTDPSRRLELMLLFGDKRLGAGRALIEGNKIDLGITTITKAEKYLERAFAQLEIVKNKKKDAAVLAKEKISKSLLKHRETILELREKLSGDHRRKLDSAWQLNQRLIEQLQKENP